MEKKKILYVTQEMKPYLNETEIAAIARQLPTHAQNQGMEIRVLMPRFGNINERRHRLHEVVRLSGINIVVGEDDYPLIIKVASLPGARLQVYFLDKEEFFQRRSVFHDKDNKFHPDNVERMIFFCKGVIETVRKFGWAPDLVHCHGWMTSLVPLYLKTTYKNDPIFKNAKVIYSLYSNSFEESMKDSFAAKVLDANSMSEANLKPYQKANNTGMNLGGITYSDALIQATDEVDKAVQELIKQNNKPTLVDEGEENFLEDYQNFYNKLLEA